jgi:tetratricopeptide (TPR) repeat protein
MLHKIFITFIIAAIAISTLFNTGCISEKTNSSGDVLAASKDTLSPADISIKKASETAAEFPDLAVSHVNLAVAILAKVRETGDYSLNRKAEESIKKALEIDSENFAAQILHTQIYLSEHKFHEGLDLAQKLAKNNPNDQSVLAAITDAQTELGLYDDAVKSAQKFVDTHPNASSYTRVAHIRSLHGDVAGAIEARKLAVRIADPLDKEGLAWFNAELGKEYWNAGNFAEAEKAFDRALEIFPDYHWALAGKGKILAGRGENEKAVEIFEKLNSRVPQTDRTIFLGDLYKIIGKNEAAQITYEEAVRRERESAASDMHRIALFWADHDTNLNEALEIARKDRKVNSDLAASDTLAWCYFKKGKFVEAKRSVTEALRLKTKNALFYFHAAMIENAIGNKPAAIKYFRLALETNPAFDLIHAETAKQRLAELAR